MCCFLFVDAAVLHCSLTVLVIQLGDAHSQVYFRFLLLIKKKNMLFLIVLSNAAAPLLTLCLNAETTAVLRALFRATIL